MTRDYDQSIARHYQHVADSCGLDSTSTMADVMTRERETHAIVRFVERALAARRAAGAEGPATVLEVGCGNGYTLSVLAARWPTERFVGVEPSQGLRALAASRFPDAGRVTIRAGDIRDGAFGGDHAADLLICQRVLINLLDVNDQHAALRNIVHAVRGPEAGRPGGSLLFIEAHASPLARLNEARAEFGLPPIAPAEHNLYLADDFFDIPQLRPLPGDGPLASNMLSTHYFVARVLHPLALGDRAFKRNSEFVRFFSSALPPDVGDYSPLKLHMFEKVGSL
jgi:SAM-dependent methyltransferase